MRLMAEDYIKLRNANAAVGPATEYHNALRALAAGKEG